MVRVTLISRDAQLRERVALSDGSTVKDLLNSYTYTPNKVVVYCNGYICDIDDELESDCEYEVANKKADSGC